MSLLKSRLQPGAAEEESAQPTEEAPEIAAAPAQVQNDGSAAPASEDETNGDDAEVEADAKTAAEPSVQQQEAAETADQQPKQPEQETAEDDGNADDNKEEAPDEKDEQAEAEPQPVILADRKALEIDKWDDPKILQSLPSDEKVIRFGLRSRLTHVVQVPDALLEAIKLQPAQDDENTFDLVDAKMTTVGRQNVGGVITIAAEGEQWLLEFREHPIDKTFEQYIDAFVIEVADFHKKERYLCTLKEREPDELQIQFGWNEQGEKIEPSPVALKYIWAKELSIVSGKLDNGNSRKSGDVDHAGFLDVSQEEKLLKINISPKLQNRIDELTRNAQNVNRDLGQVGEKLKDLEQEKSKRERFNNDGTKSLSPNDQKWYVKQKKEIEEKKAEHEGTRKSIGVKIGTLQRELSNQSFTILDPWGLPVATIKLQFETIEPAKIKSTGEE